MKRTIAVPLAGGRSCPHFGRCEAFALLDVDGDSIADERIVTPPAHAPGAYPRFLADAGADVVLTGGMGVKARRLFDACAIDVRTGIGVEEPRSLVERFLRDELPAGPDACDHGAPGHVPNCGGGGDGS